MSKTLYEQDFQLWLERTIRQLQKREFALLDIDNLIEELTELGKSEKRTTNKYIFFTPNSKHDKK